MRALLAAFMAAALLGGCGTEPEREDPARAALERELEQARESETDEALKHFHLASVYRKYGLHDSAIVSYARSVQAQPGFAEAYFHLADLYYSRGKAEEAVGAYREAIKVRPDFSEAYNNLGFIYKKSGDLQKAEEVYRKALEYAPGFAQGHNNLGQIHKARGDSEGAEAAFLKALELDAGLEQAYVNLASVYRDGRRRGDEFRLWGEYLQRFGTSSIYASYAAERLAALETPAAP